MDTNIENKRRNLKKCVDKYKIPAIIKSYRRDQATDSKNDRGGRANVLMIMESKIQYGGRDHWTA
ncbi:MAG: hypothetical protein HFH80_09565 [Lachnospiraceae bacterium]|nr:hypothetical protein [Lachnospiraceae bacterium]